MKQITRNITTQESTTLVVLTAISFFIWFAGPHFMIANHHPLLGPEKRFGIIMVLFLGWLLLSIVFAAPEKKTNSTETTQTPEALKKLNTLQGRFSGAIQFLQKTLISKQGQKINLAHLPWYVLIGPQQVGKTSLLANSSINFILSKQFKPETLKSLSPSECCDWWVTRDLVLIDVPSTYIHCRGKTNKNSPRASLHNVLWQNLLNLIHDHRKTESLNGVVVALNLPELMKQNNNMDQKSIVIDIKFRLHELREKFGKHLPCYFIITKCDLLPGFTEFFSESTQEELAQFWGVTLPALQLTEKLSDLVSHRFNALIKRLNKQLIWRLHQERNPKYRALVKDFPLHMERVKENIVQFVKALGISDLHLNGIYLTSAIQSTETENTTGKLTINPPEQHALQILQEQPSLSKPYFVRQLITQGLLHINEQPVVEMATQVNPWQRRAIQVATLVTVTLAATFMGYDFQQGMQQAYAIQNNLTQYQFYIQQSNPQGDHLIKALPLLNALQAAADTSNHRFSRLMNRITVYSNKSQQTANEVYKKALLTIVMPEIKNDLEKYLQISNEKNPARLYAALKAYLMLNDTTHLEADFIENTLAQLHPDLLDEKSAAQLSIHITAALSSGAPTLTLDNNLIANARTQLANLPSTELAYAMLKNNDNNNQISAIKLGTNSENAPVFISKALSNQIPNMFTADGFKKILAGEIATAATEATQGNWVTGTLSSTQDATTLSEQVRTQYVSNYIDIWESQLANIQLYAPKDMTELNIMLETLTSNNSPLLQLLETIQHNTAFDLIMASSPKLQTLNTLLANASNNQNNVLYQMFVSLRELHMSVQQIMQTNDLGNAAFQMAKQHALNPSQDPIGHMNVLAQQIPDPMKTWLTNMSAQSWTLISRAAAHYIDAAWQNNVMSMYHAQLADRFPFSRTAKEEVDLQNFTRFLGQQGLLTNFYQTYLKPFVDESQADWHWRDTDHSLLPFKNNVLAQIQNAAKIQRAFFPNGDNQLYVQFALQPVSLEATLKSVNLTINGQQINYAKNETGIPRVISWPGNNHSMHATSINFITPTNQLITDTIKGDWGWFRLVDKATQTVNSRKEILLNFEVDGHTAKYLLLTQGHMNPFLPMNIEKMQLPETLV